MQATKKRFRKAAAAAGVLLAWTVPALAQQFALPTPRFAPPNLTPKGVAGLAMNCAICHGPGGRPAAGSSIAALAGRPEPDLVDAMRRFKEGSRAGTIMYQVAKGYSDEEIVALARYFSGASAKGPR